MTGSPEKMVAPHELLVWDELRYYCLSSTFVGGGQGGCEGWGRKRKKEKADSLTLPTY